MKDFSVYSYFTLQFLCTYNKWYVLWQQQKQYTTTFYCLSLANYSYFGRPRCILCLLHISFSSSFLAYLVFKLYDIQHKKKFGVVILLQKIFMSNSRNMIHKIVSKVSDKTLCQNVSLILYILWYRSFNLFLEFENG